MVPPTLSFEPAPSCTIPVGFFCASCSVSRAALAWPTNRFRDRPGATLRNVNQVRLHWLTSTPTRRKIAGRIGGFCSGALNGVHPIFPETHSIRLAHYGLPAANLPHETHDLPK